ncbi:hypothetical protein Purlil1_12840 [Purpureocillium lilacinum]|uniref:Single-strand DNA deaminase toxin A-like C-terminal domain-containing protein n=1 Tax=Purpureocillium lilacinum TaxID=33203 RepID=A0ABR0BFR4_PURLI|nr:hypothetical protein Purlil1_12840 [Purpureocillium lilacinum]
MNRVYYEIDKNHYRFIPGTAYSFRGESPSALTTNHDPNLPRINLSASSRSLLLTADLDQRNKSKAIAGMRRKGGLPDVFAVSGWTDIGDPVVASKYWTEQALRLCELIGYELTPDPEKDQGVRGRFNASHVEKQLAAYFIHSHAFLSEELDLSRDNNVSEEPTDDLAGLIKKLDIEETAKASPRRHRVNERRDGIDRERITALWKTSPPRMLKDAMILVTRPVCFDCRDFIRCVNREVGLRIEAHNV